MSAKTYPGISLFPSFKPGSHNWLKNASLPFFNASWTKPSGKKRYQNFFLELTLKDGTPNPSISLSETKTHVLLKISKKPGHPIAKMSGTEIFAKKS